jgi:hypothetical protein
MIYLAKGYSKKGIDCNECSPTQELKKPIFRNILKMKIHVVSKLYNEVK